MHYWGEFEKIKKKSGGVVEGFAINPLSCVDFATVFSSLGYSTTPHPDFGLIGEIFICLQLAGVGHSMDSPLN